MFTHIEAYPGDPIFLQEESFHLDSRANKVNLGVGFYYDEDGRIPLLNSVQLAEAEIVAKHLSRSYLPMEGTADYCKAIQWLLFGQDHPVLDSGCVATIQTIGGSGALKIGADLLKQYFPSSEVWVSNPTWDNHRSIFEGAGFKVNEYPYYDQASQQILFVDMLAVLESLPPHSIVLLHACCHNPTGMDLSNSQWLRIIEVIAKRALIPFLDMAYQGFGDGLNEDAFSIRAMATAGIRFCVSNSLSKNLSLYGERCGALSVVCANDDEAARLLGQMKFTVRRNYSSPPIHGSRIASMILNDADLYAQWCREIVLMRTRIKTMGQQLFKVLTDKLPGHNFEYLLKQRGMFGYTGLSSCQIKCLREAHAVYLIPNGRICLAGLNHNNINHVASAMAMVVGSSVVTKDLP